jgi:hypothetical protein
MKIVLLLVVIAYLQAVNGSFSILSGNVGTVDVENPQPGSCPEHPYIGGLCSSKQEDAILKHVNQIQPHIIMFQEIISTFRCIPPANDTDPDHICTAYLKRQPFEQIERITGPQYKIACDSRDESQCIAVLANLYDFDLPDKSSCKGNVCMKGQTMGNIEGCDHGIVSSVDIRVKADQSIIQYISVHPIPVSDCEKDRCARAVYAAAFNMIHTEKVIIAGDMNNDIYRFGNAYPSGEFLLQQLSKFKVMNPFIRENLPLQSHLGLYTLDFIAFSSALYNSDLIPKGFKCDVLGQTPGTERLDAPMNTFDHRVLHCSTESYIKHVEPQPIRSLALETLGSLVKYNKIVISEYKGSPVSFLHGTLNWKVNDVAVELPIGVPSVSKNDQISDITHLVEGTNMEIRANGTLSMEYKSLIGTIGITARLETTLLTTAFVSIFQF